MNYFSAMSSRFIAFVLLIPFIFISCPVPGSPPQAPQVVITPGEGTPRYFYVDSGLKASDTDTGRTALIIEDNKNAKGAAVVADKVDNGDDRVLIYNANNKSVVSMFFKSGKNFPYYMIVKQNSETVRAYLSSYIPDNSSSYLTFFQNEQSLQLSTVINRNIFTLYQNDAGLTSDQNLRLRNITIALGICGSLYNSFEDPAPFTLKMERSYFSSFFCGIVQNVFRDIPVIAMAAAVITVYPVTFIYPNAGVTLKTLVNEPVTTSDPILVTLGVLETMNVAEGPPPTVNLPMISVNNEKESIKNGTEFHISRGADVVLEFYSPGMDNTNVELDSLLRNKQGGDVYLGWEKDNPSYPGNANSRFFTMTIDKTTLPKDRFLVKIKRSLTTGSIADGKVAFGFRFGNDNLHINGEIQPIEYKFYNEAAPSTRTDTVVVKFCIDPTCPDYKD